MKNIFIILMGIFITFNIYAKEQKQLININLGDEKYKLEIYEVKIIKVLPKKGNNPFNQKDPINNTFINNKIVYIPPDEIGLKKGKCHPLVFTAEKVGLFLSEERCGLGIPDGTEGVLFRIADNKIVLNIGKKFFYVDGNLEFSSPANPFYGINYYLLPGNLYFLKVKNLLTKRVWEFKTKVYNLGKKVKVYITEIN